ncbi:multicopper oxidase domain-containing protein [Nibribacter ruber]|nr:multicopper oxidase domain-containing protein [Nibribacter ruber]
MTVSQFQQDLGLGLKDALGKPILTTVWGYNDQYPGPTIVATKGKPVSVKWLNRLVDANGNALPHLLPVDPTIDLAKPTSPGVPIVTHLHGGHTESASDGLPEAWYTPYGQSKGPIFKKGEQVPYYYDNSQEAATLWYHDHTLGITRLNVYAGLAGFYLLTDGIEKALQQSNWLPAQPYDIGLAIQDRMFTADGQLFYPSESEVEGTTGPSILPEFFGDIILVNGKAWPKLKVEPRQYRFRLLNGSDSRFYNLKLPEGVAMWQIASDQGLLAQPILQNELLLGPGERKEVILDFSNAALQGKTLILTNNARTPYPFGDDVDADDSPSQIMAFSVTLPLNKAYPLTFLPATFNKPLAKMPPATKTRKLILFEGEDEYGRLLPMLGTMEGGAMRSHDPITENPGMNKTEIWEIYNLTPDAHPIHLHLVSFRVLSNQKFNGTVNEETGMLSNVQLEGPLMVPEPGQAGRKDTYPVAPGQVTRLIATFDKQGLYTWHCHILSHEDHDMMRPLYVGQLPTKMLANQPIGSDEKNDLFQVVPNPFSGAATITVKLPESSQVGVKLLDLNGHLRHAIEGKAYGKGAHQLFLNGHNLPAGIYVCEVTVNQQSYRQRLVVAR